MLQHADTGSLDEHHKLLSGVHIIDLSKENLSISKLIKSFCMLCSKAIIGMFLYELFIFVDVTVSPNSELEQLHIKSSDTNIPSPLAHNHMLSSQTSDDIKQWYSALQESNLLENSVISCRKRSHPSFLNKEVCVCVTKSDNLLFFKPYSNRTTVQLAEIFHLKIKHFIIMS